MKNTLYILLIICLASCSGDYEYVRFETSQPDGVIESKSFNRKVKGEYINCTNPDDKLIVTNNLILNSRTLRFKTHRNDLELDSTITVNRNNNDELSELFISEGYKIQINGDTINAFLTDIDTVFRISENQVLKKFKGSYFLNFKRGEHYWDVSRLNLTKDTLLVGQISPSDTLLRFDFVSKTEEFDDSDSTTTTEYSINPSRKEFKKLMKPNSFEECECYYKKK
jgi:hypothetical protein